MPRSSTAAFACAPLAELTRQLLFTPPARRAVQITKAEQLHDQIEPEAGYPLEFIVYRVTGYRSEYRQADLLVGAAVQRDLRLLIDKLSHSIALADDPQDPGVPGDELARQLHVTTKTLSRWRNLGLRWRWVLPPPVTPSPLARATSRALGPDHPGSKPPARRPPQKRVVYPRRAVARFLQQHPDVVQRAGQFTQMPPELRQRLLDRARRLAQARQVSLHQVAQHLARRTGRSVETLRQLFLKHDQAHPRDPIFRDRTAPLDARQKRVIARAWRMGVSLRKIAERFQRTRSTLHRAIQDVRVAGLRQLDLSHQVLPTFARPDAMEVYLRPLPPALWESLPPTTSGTPAPPPSATAAASGNESLITELAQHYHRPALRPQVLRPLLVRMHFLRHLADRQREQLDRYAPRKSDLDQIDAWVRQARATRSLLAQGCLPPVWAAVRQHAAAQAGAAAPWLELLTAAHATLYDAIAQFDLSGKGEFEPYLSWSIMRRLATLTQPPPAPDTPGPSPGHPVGHAHRRLSAGQIWEHLLAQARAADMDLTTPPALSPLSEK